MRIAVIDLGTNTFNLLVAEREERLRVLHSEEVGVFLGRGGIEKGVIAEDAFARGLTALQALGAKARALGAARITGFGTSALRNARNGQAFVEQALARTGIPITIIPGEEEAGLILDGVRQAVPFGPRPMLVMDIGGGSIEFILATDKALMWKRSFELGVTRLRDRFAPSDPMTLEEQFRIASHLDAQLEPLWAVVDRHEPHALVGSAGSFDTLAAMVAAERGEAIVDDRTTLAFSALDLDRLKEHLMPMDPDARLHVPGLPAYRVDTIALALIAIERVLIAGAIRELQWSRYALKEGAAMRVG
ncbi:MAG: phosphatase [Bacteroidetes bacterium]|nr:phosphatase [Bacteroidota bacterium]